MIVYIYIYIYTHTTYVSSDGPRAGALRLRRAGREDLRRGVARQEGAGPETIFVQLHGLHFT